MHSLEGRTVVAPKEGGPSPTTTSTACHTAARRLPSKFGQPSGLDCHSSLRFSLEVRRHPNNAPNPSMDFPRRNSPQSTDVNLQVRHNRTATLCEIYPTSFFNHSTNFAHHPVASNVLEAVDRTKEARAFVNATFVPAWSSDVTQPRILSRANPRTYPAHNQNGGGCRSTVHRARPLVTGSSSSAPHVPLPLVSDSTTQQQQREQLSDAGGTTAAIVHAYGTDSTPLNLQSSPTTTLTSLVKSLPLETVPQVEFSVLPESSTSMSLVLWVDGIRQVIRPHRPDLVRAPLAPIAPPLFELSHFVTLAQSVSALTPNAVLMLSWIMSDVIRSEIPAVEISHSTFISRSFSQHDLHLLLDSGLLTSGKAILVQPVFKVLKSDQLTSRFILDARNFNELFKAHFRCPKLELPDLRVVVRTSLQFSWCWSVDAVSFFYQIPICSSLSSFFGVRLGSARGEFLQLRMAALPMGVVFAPSLAQEISRILCDIVRNRLPNRTTLLFSWIDNFVCFAESSAEAYSALHTLQQLAAELHLECKPPVGPAQQADILGTHFDLLNHSVSLPTKMKDVLANIVQELGTKHTFTPRHVLHMFGTVFWCNFLVGRIALCTYHHLLEFLRTICRAQLWDQPTQLLPHVADALSKLTSSLINAKLDMSSFPTTTLPDTVIWSDASLTHLAAIFQHNNQDLSSFSIPTPPDPHHIFILELLAVAVASDLWNCRNAIVAVDNQPMFRALLRGHSSSEAADILLSFILPRLSSCTFGWIQSKLQRADALTRPPFRTLLPPRTPQHCTPIWLRLASSETSSGKGEGGANYPMRQA